MTNIVFTEDGFRLDGEIPEIKDAYSDLPGDHASPSEFTFVLGQQQCEMIEDFLIKLSRVVSLHYALLGARWRGYGCVAHLAKHGRKARTRKKNKNRAFRLLQKEEYLCK